MTRTTITVGMGFATILTITGLIFAGESTKAAATQVTFDTVQPGSLPTGWKVEATNPHGKPAPWEVATDSSAPSSPNILRAVPRSDNFGGTYNLCWTNSVDFLNGEIEVRLRADTGHEDQGGGPIWRVRDRNNYYISRYNPLEHNFRVYIVKDGARKMLDSASRIEIPKGQWFTIRIVQHGDHIEGWLDGKKLLDARDTTFTESGGVGLWTKADAATSFDDFTVRPASE